MDDTPNVTVTYNGEELLWDFKFPQALREDIHVIRGDDNAPVLGWFVEEGIAISVVNTQGIMKLSVGEDVTDRRRDGNLRKVFGG